MAIHIRSLDIQSYKGIQNLKLDHLNHINILTGNNNSGKTCILELLSTIHSPQDIGIWLRRGRLPVYGYAGVYYNTLFNLFPVQSGLDIPVGFSYITEDDHLHQIKVSANLEETQLTGYERREIDRYSRGELAEDDDALFNTNCLHLQFYFDDYPVHEEQVYDIQSRISMFVNRRPSGIRTRYVSPTDHADRISLNEVLSNSLLYNEMLDILKEFDPNIINIIAVDNGNHTRPAGVEYMVVTKDGTRPLPITSYGDGMKKSLLLLSAMLSAKDGILLLDEFETAIHTSGMDHVFSWLLNSALKLGVQIFMTSHSKEAINKVLRCDEKLESKISYYTLFKYEGKNLVRFLPCSEAIRMQDQGGLDIR